MESLSELNARAQPLIHERHVIVSCEKFDFNASEPVQEVVRCLPSTDTALLGRTLNLCSYGLMNHKKWITTLLGLAIASLLTHLYLSQHHYGLTLGLDNSSVGCNISTRLSCDAAALSPFSEILGLPLAVLAATTHGALILLVGLYMIGLLRRPQIVLGAAGGLTYFIAAASVVMAFISTFLLKAFCPVCILAYLLSFAQAFAARKAMASSLDPARPWEALKVAAQDHRWVLVVFVLIPASALMLHSMWVSSAGSSNLSALVRQSIEDWKAAPLQQFDAKKGLVSPDLQTESDLTLVEFADFLCPHCKKASPTLKAFTDHNRKVKMVFKPFPLDKKCNDAISHEGDGVRCELAYAALCAEQVGQKGFAMAEAIFEVQHQWSIANVEEKLKSLGDKLLLDSTKFEECRKNPETRQLVLAMAAEGALAKIGGVPSIFANGRKLQGGQLVPVLRAALEASQK